MKLGTLLSITALMAGCTTSVVHKRTDPDGTIHSFAATTNVLGNSSMVAQTNSEGIVASQRSDNTGPINAWERGKLYEAAASLGSDAVEGAQEIIEPLTEQ